MTENVAIDPAWADHATRPEIMVTGVNYLYRGYVIRIFAGEPGYSVYLPDREDFEDEDGWGATLFDAMAVINELVDGEPRRKQ